MARTTKETDKKLNKKKKAVSSVKKKENVKNVTKKVSTKSTSKKSSRINNKISSNAKKETAVKKIASKNKVSSKKTASKKSIKNPEKKVDILEYYDLPYRYNQTVVKVLAQTPKTLFVYWDISDKDRKSYVKQYGENFFENTRPVLIITNTTMNYSFEIEINDFANCWYFNINDENCKYLVELGRRPKQNTNTYIPNNYIYVTSSNTLESPNRSYFI